MKFFLIFSSTVLGTLTIPLSIPSDLYTAYCILRKCTVYTVAGYESVVNLKPTADVQNLNIVKLC